ncbi:MAG: hypothetical protein NT165_03820 [Candidatus Falkowbacteria bacterium]|nr:hypothetical protein [Candidatus Falkowbacteria bacterium]
MDNLDKKPNNFQVWIAEFLKNYFGVVLFFLVAIMLFASYVFMLLPHFKQAVTVVHQNSSDQQKKYVEVAQKLTDLRSLINAYNKIDPTVVKKVEEFLPSEYIQEQLFLELEQVIIRNGYTVNSISIQKELGSPSASMNSKIGRVRVSVLVSGVDYLDFKKLLKIIESNIRLMDVTTLSFSPSGQSASFSFSTYFFREN